MAHRAPLDLSSWNGTAELTSGRTPLVLDLPLRGEWLAPTTPAKRVPSHGLDAFGETYAYDFVKPGPASDKFYDASALRYLVHGVPLSACFGWGAEILAPCDGEIALVSDGLAERDPVSLRDDLKYMAKVTKRFKAGTASYREIAGNYIIMKCTGGFYALFAHLKAGSINARAGQRVSRGEFLGQVGHSGNSTAPHLHFQAMDRADLEMAEGLPCAFREYEELRGGNWTLVENGVPGHVRRIRSTNSPRRKE
jgi:murein DD-endopeptidase MepM/ murein hydrolase activator NlpD